MSDERRLQDGLPRLWEDIRAREDITTMTDDPKMELVEFVTGEFDP